MKIGCVSYKLSQLQALSIITGHKTTYARFNIGWFNIQKNCNMFVGWGYGYYSQPAQILAQKYNKPFFFLEDGFVRSPFVSSLSKQPYSLVLDSKAPYYDASVVSDLEDLICHTTLSDIQRIEVTDAIDYFVTHKLSKFAIITDNANPILPKGFGKDSILLIDQVAGDLSLKYGGVDNDTAKNAFDMIAKNNPDKKIYLKLHPEVLAGKKKGCFDFAHSHKNVVCIPDIDLSHLLPVKPIIYVLTSLAGFEGILHGCHVTVFGLPWYAAYGLTVDKHPQAHALRTRRKSVDLQTVFYCAYMVYTHYVNPVSGKKSDFWEIMHHFARIKKHINMMRGHLIAVGIRPWKRKGFYHWIKTPFNQVRFTDDYDKISHIIHKNSAQNCKIIVWNYKNSDLIEKITTDYPQIQIIRTEDGFIRSYGLGSDFFPPLSLCFDTGHLYFYHSAVNQSDFHKIANSAPFVKPLLEKAKSLQHSIIANNISKYNLEDTTPLSIKTDKQIIFVAGQVSGDASLRYGGLPCTLQNDYALLSKVRTDYPDAYILYKPHPDVSKGNRKQGDNDDKCIQFYDQKEIDASVIACINSSDKVAVLTSQTGFDALIRGKAVICYGESFYKNYGLCQNDTYNKNHAMDINSFIHTALLEYPIYKNGTDYITPNIAIDIILAQKAGRINPLRRYIIGSKILKYIYKIFKWVI